LYLSNNQPKDLKYIISDLIMFTKPYEGTLWRNHDRLDLIRFYDEREWRWIPEINRHDCKIHLEYDEFLDDTKRKLKIKNWR